ncbi:MAG: DUF6114 domain-containing protein [Desulfurococcaceae archaeon]
MSEKPTAAFVLSLIGGVLVILSSILVIVAGGLVGEILPVVGGVVATVGVVGLFLGVLMIVGAIMINTGEPGKVKTGSILVLVFSILSLFISGGGFLIGFILGLIGGILGLTWKPPQKLAPTTTAQQPSS